MNRKEKFFQLRGKRKELNTLVSTIHDQVFERTNCLDCAACCKSAPPLVTSSDIKRIAKFLGLTPKKFKRNYTIQDVDGSQSFDSIPCKFLQEDNACSIYEVRPNACRSYPHTNDGDFLKRLNLHEINAKICPATEEILQLMNDKISKTYNL